jgi:cysteinyl-tRNA synthetase
LETTRLLDGQDEKKDKADFALWKSAAPEHIMRWKSPWGEGFPGWHIECSAMATKYLGAEFDIHGGGMDLQFPHHESEIAQSTICNHSSPARYWLHNNMITINGKKMGKSYNNVIKLTEMFSGNHPLLTQAFAPMTVRFFILQSHYRSPVDFSSEALLGSEKALKRLWEAYEVLKKLEPSSAASAGDSDLEAKLVQWLNEMDEFMDDDFSTAKIIANMFEMAPVINGIKDGHITKDALSATTWAKLLSQFKIYLEDIFGLQQAGAASDGALGNVMALLIEMRKEAKAKKDYATSDKIRKQLASFGIELKDEKDGAMSWSL